MIRAISYNLPLMDEEFDKIYPSDIQLKSERHWTPINVAKKASEFLVTKPGTKVLDIGSGVGKFCIVGSQVTSGLFYGIEQRRNLVEISREIIKKYNLQNITIVHSNITSIDFSKYNAFYFYNSFHENIDPSSKIDNNVIISFDKYIQYRDYILRQFIKAPIGTRIVTHSGFDAEIPPCFALLKKEKEFDLKYWIKDKKEIHIPIYR